MPRPTVPVLSDVIIRPLGQRGKKMTNVEVAAPSSQMQRSLITEEK
jgi:hypothetical protein